MLESLFDKKNLVNNGRQIEADIAKTICIIGMVMVHCFEEINHSGANSEGFGYIMVTVLDCLFGAATFMFCMGMGISYSKSTPVQTFKRGIQILIIAYVLNVIRGVLPLLCIYAASGNPECLYDVPRELINLDILNFAGLALMLIGLLRMLKHSHILLPVIAVLMSVTGSFVRGFDTGNFYLNQVVGLFFGTNVAGEETFAHFPLFNWFIFVVVGFMFGEVFKYCKNKPGFYLRVGPVAWIIVIVYMAIAIPNKIGMMGYDMNMFYHLTTPEALICMIASFAVFSLYFAISPLFKGILYSFVTSTSRNINSIYCIHWTLLAWIWYPFDYGMGIKKMPTEFIVVFALALFTVSAIVAYIYKKLKNKRKERMA